MDPLQSVPMPVNAVLVGLTTANSWPSATQHGIIRCAYIATNSTQRVSFVTLQSGVHTSEVLRVASRPSLYDDMPYGVVIVVTLARDITDEESIHLSLAQAGATTYYPPQQIDDAR